MFSNFEEEFELDLPYYLTQLDQIGLTYHLNFDILWKHTSGWGSLLQMTKDEDNNQLRERFPQVLADGGKMLLRTVIDEANWERVVEGFKDGTWYNFRIEQFLTNDGKVGKEKCRTVSYFFSVYVSILVGQEAYKST